LAASVQVPRIVVNAKLYAEATGPGARRLLDACAAVGGTALAPPLTELAGLARYGRSVPLLAQHVDGLAPGVGTGFVTAAMAKAAGAEGTLLNHAEHKLKPAELKASLAAARDAGLWTLCCADSLAEARRLAKLSPTAIAVEPPELIGGKVSVTSADPAVVSDAVQAVRSIDDAILVLCGAGVKTGRDVRAARKLGAHGVLLASGVAKAKDPLAALKDLASGL
jgi:triosephosphate isomerase